MSSDADVVQIAPSVLASDFLHLEEELRDAERAGAQRLHLDVMDGRFVPNISIGTPIVQAIRSATAAVLETHLMILEPERYVPVFAEAGADLITVHVEVSPHLYRTVQQIHDLGKRAGVALNPATTWHAIEEIVDCADLILVMTVNPGFGGQAFISAMVPKIARIRELLDRKGSMAELEVDGGIDVHTAPHVISAGARVLVAGTSIFKANRGVVTAFGDLRTAALSGLT
ncbi:MAG: ribulose-phosphate 3-epimerase [Chloroflexota bacterium]